MGTEVEPCLTVAAGPALCLGTLAEVVASGSIRAVEGSSFMRRAAVSKTDEWKAGEGGEIMAALV